MNINTDVTLVPNWFDREDLEDVIGSEVTDGEFKQFKTFIEKSDMPNEISWMIKDMWQIFKG